MEISKSGVNMLEMELYKIYASTQRVELGEKTMAQLQLEITELIEKALIEKRREEAMRELLFQLANSL